MGVQVSQHGSPAYVQGFPARKGKQTTMMSFSDIMNVMLMHRVGGYIRRVCMSLRAIIRGFWS